MNADRWVVGLLLLIPVFCLADDASDATQWGALRGRFAWNGVPPKQNELPAVGADAAFVGPLVDESMIVDQKSRGVANVVIYLWQDREKPAIPVHPDYAKSAEATVNIDLRGGRYDPHVAFARTTQIVEFSNRDPIAYCVRTQSLGDNSVAFLVLAGASVRHQFAQIERLPTIVTDMIHPWMKGVLLIRDNPYAAVTDKDGKFEIKHLPVGTWRFRIWHEKAGYLRDVNRNMREEKWDKGLVTVKIEPGDNLFGEVFVEMEQFKNE